MRKHFLILMLLAILPLAGWAQVNISGVTPTIDEDSYIYSGAAPVIDMEVLSPSTAVEIDASNYDLVFYTNAKVKIEDPTAANVFNVGTYYVSAKAKANTEYTGETKMVQFTILPRPLTIAFTAYEPTYGFQLAYAANETDLDHIIYAVTDDMGTPNDDQDDVVYNPFDGTPQQKAAALAFVTNKLQLTVGREGLNQQYDVVYDGANVDGYEFTFNAENTNYQLTRTDANLDKKFSIKPKTLAAAGADAISFTAGTHVYSGNVQEATVVAAQNEDVTFTVAWYRDAALTTPVTDNKPIDVGTYYAKLTGTDNYTGDLGYDAGVQTSNKDWKFDITRKEVAIEIVDASKVYNGEDIDLTDVAINFGSIVPRDAKAMITNFGGKIVVDYTEDYTASGTKNVLYDGQGNVEGYALGVKFVDGFEQTSLFMNYGFKDANNVVQPIAYDITTKFITGITGEYTITPRPIEFKAKDVETSFGTAPVVPAVTLTPAATATVLYVAPAATDPDKANKGLVEGDAFATTDFVLGKTPKAQKGTTQYEWNVAPAGTYLEAITLAGAAFANLSATAKNYSISCTYGNVIVTGKAMTVRVNSKSIKYGDAIAQNSFSYTTNPANLAIGDVTYKIYELTDLNEKGDEVTVWENVPVGVYLIEIDPTTATEPTNYTLTDESFDAGYLIVDKKPITIAINALTVGAGTTKAKLNTYASVDEAYKDNLVGADKTTGLKFTYSFNTENVTGAIPVEKVWQANESAEPGFTAAGDLKPTATGDYAKGITAALIQKEVVNNEVVDNGWIAANESYEVTFTPGALTILAGEVFQLAGNDANLLDKIKVAAAAGTPKTITFGSRKLTREVWAAMVLPFETTVTEVSKALGYAVVDILDVTENSNDMHLKLHMGKINANQPFIVKYYKEDVEEELYTEATANEHNATLTGAKHEGDLKTAAIPASYVPVPNGTTLTLGNTYYTDDQGNGEFQANGTEVSNGTNYFTYQAEVVATYYTSAQAAEYNANLNGAKHAGDVKVAAVNNSTLDLSELAATAFVNKTIVYDPADATYVNADGNVFVQNKNNLHQFIGVYNPVNVSGGEYKWLRNSDGVLVDGATYKEQGKEVEMPRLKAYFKLNTTNGNARILIDEPDGTTTVINAVTAESMNVQAEGWYTLNGVKLQSIPTQKGIYINNGKKVVIK